MDSVAMRIQMRDHEIVSYSGWNFYQLQHNFYLEDRTIPEHWHHSLEITYVVRGCKEQTTEGIIRPAGPGTLLLTNSGIRHSLCIRKGLEGIVLLISKKALDEYCPAADGYGFDLSRSGQAAEKISRLLIRMAEAQEAGNRLDCMSFLLEILHLLNCHLISEQPLEVRHPETSHAVKAVEEFLGANYKEEITLDQIAGVLGYNRTYLSQIYKKQKGIGIFDYLKEVRIQQAMRQLKMTRKTVTEIALDCGFSSSQVFCRAFQQKTGLSPGAYRKKQ